MSQEKSQELENQPRETPLPTVPTIAEAELRKLALDMASGKVFTQLHLGEENAHLVQSVFMPLVFMAEPELAVLQEHCGMLYEYLDKAGPRSINGFPVFFSFRMLHKDDCAALWDYYKQAQVLMGEFLQPEGGSSDAPD